MRRRLRVAGLHLAISALVIVLFVVGVVHFLYPLGLARLQGLWAILGVVVLVDVGLGPLCTLVLAAPKKAHAELLRDLALVVLIQVAGFLWGAHAIWTARPVFVVFDGDTFVVTQAYEVRSVDLAAAAEPFNRLPIAGPKLAVLALPTDQKARLSLLLGPARGGPPVTALPQYFRAWDVSRKDIGAAAFKKADEIEQGLRSKQVDEAGVVVFLPIQGKSAGGWVALDESRNVLRFLAP